MLSIFRDRSGARIALAVMLLAGCASQMEPAQRSISDIEAVVSTASGEAAKYVPDQLSNVQGKLQALKASFDKQDYAAVLAGAPAVLGEAQGLAGAAAAKKDELMRELNEQWSALAATLPDSMTAIQGRLDLLGKASSRKLAAGIDLDAARTSLSNTVSLWSKAQAAFATGNLTEAVATAKTVGADLEALTSTLKMDPAAPAAPTKRAAPPTHAAPPKAAAPAQGASVPSLTSTALPPMCTACRSP
ncbi:MAG: hypothetical protein ABSH33_00790 [Steroidobacteraceae bacterium]|jgi:hypothetical protein